MKWLEAPDFVDSMNLTCTMLTSLRISTLAIFLFSFKIYKVKHVIGRDNIIRKDGTKKKKNYLWIGYTFKKEELRISF